MEVSNSAWGVLSIIAEEKAVVLNSPEDGLIHLAWEARMFELFCSLVVEQIQELTRMVSQGMNRVELIDAMKHLVAGREIVYKIRGEVSDLPGIASLVSALDQLEAAIRDKGLAWQQD